MQKSQEECKCRPGQDAEIIIEPDDADTAVVIELVRKPGREKLKAKTLKKEAPKKIQRRKHRRRIRRRRIL